MINLPTKQLWKAKVPRADLSAEQGWGRDGGDEAGMKNVWINKCLMNEKLN